MPAQIPPLDEQEYADPQMPLAHLDSDNNIIFYLMNSPFFEAQSNNSAVYNTAQGHPNGMQLLNHRPTYETELKKYNSGLQFIVAGEPKGEGQPWLIQRQHKVENRETGNPETVAEGNYYTQGTRLLMAPSLLDVVQARLLTVSTRMQQMAELSKNMTHWSPATGHTYMPPSFEPTKAANTASRIGSPTLGPADASASASQPQSKDVASAIDTAASTTQFSDDLFMYSLNLTHAYGDEYMDENPLLGEPGAFVFANSKSHVDARNKAQEQAIQASQASQASQPTTKTETQPTSVAPSAAATPKGVTMPLTLGAPSRKGSVVGLPKEEKRKRRKSKGLTSPTTPAGPAL